MCGITPRPELQLADGSEIHWKYFLHKERFADTHFAATLFSLSKRLTYPCTGSKMHLS
jgi:hypothetical protein